MNIVQITDLHIADEGEDAHGVDVRQNFLKILKEVKNRQPDRLVVTGDLCLQQGSAAVYEWIKGHLDQLDIPYFIIAGNHDDSSLMCKVYGIEKDLHQKELFYKCRWNGKSFFFLDSAVGKLSGNQLLWLSKELRELQESVTIFMHHPPMEAGVVFMDRKYAYYLYY